MMNGGLLSLTAAARQLGLRVEDFGDRAQEIWGSLNVLSESDPVAYQQYIAEQMEVANPKGFRPQTGLCLETSFIKNVSGGRVFVNLCGHEAVEMPQDASGQPICKKSPVKTNLSGLAIPLAVGKFREAVETANSFAIDVVFNPWVIAQVKGSSAFTAQVSELALSWCEKEGSRGKLSRKYAVRKDDYVGGEDGKPVFFPVEKEDLEDGATPACTEAGPSIESPEDILSALNSERQEMKICLPRSEEPKTSGSKKTKTKTISKGFLRNAKVNLYDESGSPESCSNCIFQNSKIVDLNKMSSKEASQAVASHAGSATIGKKQRKEEKEDEKFAEIAAAADPELAIQNIDLKQNDALEDLFEQLSKTLNLPKEKQLNKPAMASQSKQEETRTDPELNPAPFQVTCNEEEGVLQVRFELSNETHLSDVDVEISEKKIRLVGSKFYSETPVRLEKLIERDSARAKFNKKSKSLTITAHLQN